MRRILLACLLLLTAVTAGARQRFSYIYSYGGNSYTTLSSGSVQDLVRLTKRFSGKYLWVSLDGREYLIRDPGVLAEVARGAAALEALEPGQRALHAKMRPLERRADRIEEQIDEITDDDDHEERAEMRGRLRDLERQLRDVERELRGYEREEQKLDRREEEIERVFEAELEKIVERSIRNGVAERLR
jgi:chromosome segregation ATPase